MTGQQCLGNRCFQFVLGSFICVCFCPLCHLKEDTQDTGRGPSNSHSHRPLLAHSLLVPSPPPPADSSAPAAAHSPSPPAAPPAPSPLPLQRQNHEIDSLAHLRERLQSRDLSDETITLLCKQSGEPLEQPPGQCGNSTIGRLFQEKTGQDLGSTAFSVRPRMPSLNCHNNDLIGTIPRLPRPISFSLENLN